MVKPKKNNLKIDRFSYFLFDYDGLLVDTEKLYFETWCLVLTNDGKKVCKKFHEGKHESEVYKQVQSYLKSPMTLGQVSKYREEKYDELIKQGRLELAVGVSELLEGLQGNVLMSIVSNSIEELVKEGIRHTNIESYFEALFCVNDNLKRKPAPDLYNLALEKLSLEKGDVLALEDSKTGIISAKKAGLSVVCINSDRSMKGFCVNNNVEYFETAIELGKVLGL